MLLPMIIPATLPVRACHKAPTAKSTSATRTTDFLPRRSASTPASGLAIRAKRLVEDVIKLLSRVDIGRDRSDPMDTRVADITPVLAESISLSRRLERFETYSYPKSRPLMPAVNDRAQMNALSELEAGSSEHKLPPRSSRLPLGLSGSRNREAAATVSSLVIMQDYDRSHNNDLSI